MESLTQKRSQVRVLFRPHFAGLPFEDSPAKCKLKVLGFPRFALDRTPSTMFRGLRNPNPATCDRSAREGEFFFFPNTLAILKHYPAQKSKLNMAAKMPIIRMLPRVQARSKFLFWPQRAGSMKITGAAIT